MGLRGRQTLKPSLRNTAERNALVEQWRHLPKYCAHQLGRCPDVAAIGFDAAVSLGFYALLRAAELWDETSGTAFFTYARRAIGNEMRRLATRERNVVSIPLNGVVSDECRRYAERATQVVHFDALESADDYLGAGDEGHHGEVDDDDLAGFVERLGPTERQVVRWHFWEGLTSAEIGLRLGKPRNTVNRIRRRALLHLRELMSA